MSRTIDLTKLSPKIQEWINTLSNDELINIICAKYEEQTYQPSHQPPQPTYASAIIGKQGEYDFEKIIKLLPHEYKIINTTKVGKQGDFIISKGKLRCLVDVKKYKSLVPSKEIDKFKCDLQYGNYDAGLLISQTSKFTGITDLLCISDVTLPHATIPIMYLAELSPELIIQSIEILFLKLETIIEKQYDAERITNCISYINVALNQSTATRRNLSEMQIHITRCISTCHENLIGLEVQIKQAINQLQPVPAPLVKPVDPLLFQLSELPWDLSEYNSDKATGQYIKNSDAFNVEVLKTKINITTNSTNAEIIKHFNKKKNINIAELNQSIIDSIKLLFHV